jgi:hypothetical protein
MKINKINYSISQEERETLLRYDYLDECWYVETSIPTHITKFKKQGWEMVSQTINHLGSVQVVEFKCNNPSSITIGKAEKKKRELTEEQRKLLAERLKKARNKN